MLPHCCHGHRPGERVSLFCLTGDQAEVPRGKTASAATFAQVWLTVSTVTVGPGIPGAPRGRHSPEVRDLPCAGTWIYRKATPCQQPCVTAASERRTQKGGAAHRPPEQVQFGETSKNDFLHAIGGRSEPGQHLDRPRARGTSLAAE